MRASSCRWSSVPKHKRPGKDEGRWCESLRHCSRANALQRLFTYMHFFQAMSWEEWLMLSSTSHCPSTKHECSCRGRSAAQKPDFPLKCIEISGRVLFIYKHLSTCKHGHLYILIWMFFTWYKKESRSQHVLQIIKYLIYRLNADWFILNSAEKSNSRHVMLSQSLLCNDTKLRNTVKIFLRSGYYI